MTNKDGRQFYSGYSGLTHADISAFLGKTFSTQEQAQATMLIKAMEDFIARQCQKNFYYVDGSTDQVYEETFDGGAEEYVLFNYPIKEVTKITVDGVVKYEKGATSEWVLNDDFYVYPYKVTFEIDTDLDPQLIKIEYSIKQFWGEDLKFAIIRWAAETIGSRKYGGRDVASANVDGLSLSFNTATMPRFVADVISRYQKYVI